MSDCQPWCIGHDHRHDMCTSAAVILDFGDRGDGEFLCDIAHVDLTQTPDGTSIMTYVNDCPALDLDPEQTQAFGWALLSKAFLALGEPAAADMYRKLAEIHAEAAARGVS